MNHPKTDIEALIDECIKGDRSAQKELYKAYYNFSMNVCMRYSKSVEEAKEIMNDGFMKVFQNIMKFDKSRPFTPWLRRILVNSAINHLNKNKKFQNQIELAESTMIQSEENVMDSISYDEMLELVRELPPAYQTVFNMRAIEGYKHEEIAQMLNISVGTSKSNYARAKQKMKALLNKYFEVTN